MDDLARAAAMIAGRGGLHYTESGALLTANLTAASADGADLGSCAGLAAAAVAVGAILDAGDGYLLGAAESCLLEGQVNGCAQILALAGSVLTAGTSAAATAEEGFKYVAKVAETVEAEAAAKSARVGVEVGVDARVTELVIAGALVGIGENLVSLVYLLEASLGRRVAGMQVGVIGLGKLAVCFFQVVLAGVLVNAEDFIKVSFLLCNKLPRKTPQKRESLPLCSNMSKVSVRQWGNY